MFLILNDTESQPYKPVKTQCLFDTLYVADFLKLVIIPTYVVMSSNSTLEKIWDFWYNDILMVSVTLWLLVQ